MKSWMSADFDAVLFCKADGLEHQRGVASVEAACDVGIVNELVELFVGSMLSILSSVAAQDSG